jgi:hypothetical protein
LQSFVADSKLFFNQTPIITRLSITLKIADGLLLAALATWAIPPRMTHYPFSGSGSVSLVGTPRCGVRGGRPQGPQRAVPNFKVAHYPLFQLKLVFNK